MHNPITRGLIALGLTAVMAGSAHAQAGRYVMEPTENGYVRMDTRTGDISVCRLETDQMVCTMAADERAAFQDTLDELEGRIAVLERRLNASRDHAIEPHRMPDGEEFDRGLDRMEEFMRRFMGILEDFDQPDRL